MRVISHRGYWKQISEKNKEIAFKRSFALQYGTETDIRDFNRNLVVSHDMADEESYLLDNFFQLYIESNLPPLALNIKADGLQKELKAKLSEYNIENYFFFDMSIPDTIGYIKENLNFFSRQSEYEPVPVFYDECKGIWLDGFKSVWFTLELILNHLNNGKGVAIVSPELHGRDYLSLWKELKNEKIALTNVILCTDIPEEASKYFDL